MTVQSLCTVTFQNGDASTKDETRIAVVLQGATRLSSADLATTFGVLLNQHVGTHGLGEYLATCVSRTVAGLCQAYDISGHLDGSPHGSPYTTAAYTLPDSVGDSRGNQLCAVLALHSGAYAGTPVSGGFGTVKSSEYAIDQGAPATHSGILKLKQRQANRIYLGPLSSTAIGVDGNANPQFTDTFMTDAVDHLAFFNGNISADIGQDWMGWSRANAAVWNVTGGWVDRGVKTRRRKAFSPSTRTTW